MQKGLKKITFRTAETLIEVVMAIFVVATGSAAATSLIVTAMQSNSFSRDNLIALNLAVEGIEAIRNIRDSNWLKFGYDKDNCWNMRPEMAQGSNCELAQNLIDKGNYTVDLNTSSMNWLLSSTPASTLNLENGVTADDEFYRLEFADLDPTVSTDGDPNLTNDRDIYTSSPSPSTGISQFYRMVTVSYDTAPETADEMTITSIVQWTTQGRVHQIVLNSKLTNYQKVKVTP